MQVRGGTDFNKGKRNELAILQVMDRAYCIIRRVIPVHACAILFLVSDGVVTASFGSFILSQLIDRI